MNTTNITNHDLGLTFAQLEAAYVESKRLAQAFADYVIEHDGQWLYYYDCPEDIEKTIRHPRRSIIASPEMQAHVMRLPVLRSLSGPMYVPPNPASLHFIVLYAEDRADLVLKLAPYLRTAAN